MVFRALAHPVRAQRVLAQPLTKGLVAPLARKRPAPQETLQAGLQVRLWARLLALRLGVQAKLQPMAVLVAQATRAARCAQVCLHALLQCSTSKKNHSPCLKKPSCRRVANNLLSKWLRKPRSKPKCWPTRRKPLRPPQLPLQPLAVPARQRQRLLLRHLFLSTVSAWCRSAPKSKSVYAAPAGLS